VQRVEEEKGDKMGKFNLVGEFLTLPNGPGGGPCFYGPPGKKPWHNPLLIYVRKRILRRKFPSSCSSPMFITNRERE
jgi:hypothetical protein